MERQQRRRIGIRLVLILIEFIDNRRIKGNEIKYMNRKGELEIIVECIDIFETRFDQETGQFIQRIRV